MVRFDGDDEPNDQKPGAGIHSQKFGWILKAEMDELGLNCEFAVGNIPGFDDRIQFFVKYLKP